MNQVPEFKGNTQLTMGVELELQLINLHTGNLIVEAKDLLRRVSQVDMPGEIKPEITQAMIELNSSIHSSYHSLVTELCTMRDLLAEQARQCHIGISGGGAHAFQKWHLQRIFPTERFSSLSEQYGYLAKQFTIFGQHIHIACASGDDALYLCHAIARYIPHFIALSASSPFHQGVDTAFDCSRLAAVSAFPLSGTPPHFFRWSDFEEYYEKMMSLGIVSSIKDFYWDIRPKPEYGTVEIRICDTPLTVQCAAELAVYAQLIAQHLLNQRPEIPQDQYLVYSTNRFRAARYGLAATIINPAEKKSIPLAEDIIDCCNVLKPYASDQDTYNALSRISAVASSRKNGASWLRERYKEMGALNDVVKSQVDYWMD